MGRMVREANVDVIVGDWLSEMNIAWESIRKAEDPDTGYDIGFLQQLGDCIDDNVEAKVRLVTNAGAMNAPALSRKVIDLCDQHGHDLVVATVLGDDVSHLLCNAKTTQSGFDFQHLDHEDQHLTDWGLQPKCAAAYIGAWGIASALEEGADIVICGRVTDASPVIGAAAWWYGWSRTEYDKLAGALIAGHLIECGPYATGANFSGFKPFLQAGRLVDLGFPVAEIRPDGACWISKPESMAGTVNKYNIIAQLLYELQGDLYLNPDVVADIRSVRVEEAGEEIVLVSGTVGSPPPPSTKIMIAALGGYQAETYYFMNGIDIQEKAELMKRQLLYMFKDSKFSKLSIELYGTQADNPATQQEGTVMLRVFAQARQLEDIAPAVFKIPIYSLRMQSYPGYHMSLNFATMDPRPFMEIFPSTIAQAAIKQEVVIPKLSKRISIDAPRDVQHYAVQRPSYETAHPVSLGSFGATQRVPLGHIVHARSGDKANNSNVGFFVRHVDEYAWLQALLTVETLKKLLANDYAEQRIERCEFPSILAVHL